jgi:hypothetical protein
MRIRIQLPKTTRFHAGSDMHIQLTSRSRIYTVIIDAQMLDYGTVQFEKSNVKSS